MKRLSKIHQKLSMCMFASMTMISAPAMAEITLPTAIEFEKAISFQKPDGEPVQLKAGIYEVEMGSEKELKFDPVGAEGTEITVQALPADHDETLEEAKALLTPSPDNNADKLHVMLWMPEGVALEAIGSFSGVFSRSTLTWGTEETGDDVTTTEQAPLTVNFDKSLYFKTTGGEPKSLKPGDYEVGFADDGMVLTPVGGKPEDAITIESESLGTSAAIALPEFNGNPNLELLMLATVGGQSIIAVGSEDGTFPRGLRSWAKKKARGLKNKAKEMAEGAVNKVGGKVRKSVRAAYGKAKKHGRKYVKGAARKAINAAKKQGRRYATKATRAAYRAGKGIVTKFCKSKAAQAAASSSAYGAAATGGCVAINAAKKLR